MTSSSVIRTIPSSRWRFALLGLLLLCAPTCQDIYDNPAGSPESRCLYGTTTPASNEEETDDDSDSGWGRDLPTELGCFLAYYSFYFNGGFVLPTAPDAPAEERARNALLICLALQQWRDGCYARSDSYAK